MKENIGVLNKVESCKNCMWRNYCWKQQVCESFKPIDSDKYCESLYQYIRKNITPSGESKLTRHVYQMSNWGIYTDCTTLDQYYINMINDDLKIIRHKDTAYVFNIDQVIEMYRLEPKLHIKKYEDGVYYISL
jgi:hypothetical protein